MGRFFIIIFLAIFVVGCSANKSEPQLSLELGGLPIALERGKAYAPELSVVNHSDIAVWFTLAQKPQSRSGTLVLSPSPLVDGAINTSIVYSLGMELSASEYAGSVWPSRYVRLRPGGRVSLKGITSQLQIEVPSTWTCRAVLIRVELQCSHDGRDVGIDAWTGALKASKEYPLGNNSKRGR